MYRCSDKHLPTITMERPSMVHSNCIVRGKSAVNMRKRKVDFPANVDHEALSCSVHLWFLYLLCSCSGHWYQAGDWRNIKCSGHEDISPLCWKVVILAFWSGFLVKIEGTPLAYQWVIRRVIQGQIRCCCQNVVFTPRTDYRFWFLGLLKIEFIIETDFMEERISSSKSWNLWSWRS